MGLLRSYKITLRRLDPRVIEDLCDDVEAMILAKVKIDFISKMELMKNNIMRAIATVPWHMGIEDGYEEVTEDFEVAISSGKE